MILIPRIFTANKNVHYQRNELELPYTYTCIATKLNHVNISRGPSCRQLMS